jgi:hypothetical protein
MRERKRSRQTVFVCVAMREGVLLTRIISAPSPKEAADLFFQETLLQPKEVLGPFYKKKTQVIENTRSLKFSGQTKRAICGDWIVDAFFLQDPEGQAYLVFLKRVDDKKNTPPQGTIIVPISDLRFL